MSKVPDQNDKHCHWLEKVHFEIVTIVTFSFTFQGTNEVHDSIYAGIFGKKKQQGKMKDTLVCHCCYKFSIGVCCLFPCVAV